MLESVAAAGLMGVGWTFLFMAATGLAYGVMTVVAIRRFFIRATTPAASVAPHDDAVTLLKPLCGNEPRLEQNLGTFLDQRHRGALQVLCGYAKTDDEAAHAVAALQAGHPTVDIATIVSGQRHGPSAKVSNLVNLDVQAKHPIIILSDSDMAVDRDYLATVLDALDQDGVGAVSLLYAGRGDAGFWSTLAAAGISYQFLPNAVFGVWSSLATPCMGSTIAMHRDVLQRIGGFKAFAGRLADDYAIGEAVRGQGLAVSVPPYVATHACAERSFLALWKHEVRWGATVRGVVPLCYVGSVVTHPLPLALLGALATGEYTIGCALALASLLVRTVQVVLVDWQVTRPTAPLWLLPLRDCLSFAVFIASLFAQRVEWRGNHHIVQPRGQLSTDQEYPA